MGIPLIAEVGVKSDPCLYQCWEQSDVQIHFEQNYHVQNDPPLAKLYSAFPI